MFPPHPDRHNLVTNKTLLLHTPIDRCLRETEHNLESHIWDQ